MKSNRFNYQDFGFGSGLSRFIQEAFDGLDDLGLFTRNARRDLLHPAVDLYEDDEHFLVTLELPGVQKSDVRVELVDGRLEIGATISHETADGRKNFPLKRSIPLPDLVGEQAVSAKLEDGILSVTLPKAEEVKPRSITIE